MKSSRRRRVLGFIGAFLSVDVFIAALLALILMWVGVFGLSDALSKLYTAGARVTTAASNGMDRVDSALLNFTVKLSNLQQVTSQISQSVQDKGVIALLLPPEKEEQLSATFADVRDTISTVTETVASVHDFYQTFARLPFVNAPQLDSGLLGNVGQLLDKIDGLIQQVKQGVADVRNFVSGAVGKVGEALGGINDAVTQLRSEIAPIRGYLTAANQTVLPLLQVITLPLLLIVAVILTPLYLWALYAMVYMFRAMRAYRRGVPQSAAAALKSGAAQAEQTVSPAAAETATPPAAAPPGESEPPGPKST